jgi:hypothetical protein
VVGDELAEFGYGHLFEPVDARHNVLLCPHRGKGTVAFAALAWTVEQKVNAAEFQGYGFFIGIHGARFQSS